MCFSEQSNFWKAFHMKDTLGSLTMLSCSQCMHLNSSFCWPEYCVSEPTWLTSTEKLAPLLPSRTHSYIANWLIYASHSVVDRQCTAAYMRSPYFFMKCSRQSLRYSPLSHKPVDIWTVKFIKEITYWLKAGHSARQQGEQWSAARLLLSHVGCYHAAPRHSLVVSSPL